jgi:hypothetical protein
LHISKILRTFAPEKRQQGEFKLAYTIRRSRVWRRYKVMSKLKERRKNMPVPTKTTGSKVQPQPMCGLDYALADIAAGRVTHYSSLEELINKFA